MSMQNRQTVSLDKIHITDEFWSRYLDLVQYEMLPYQWKAINDEIPEAPPSHSIENFRIAAHEKEGAYYGALFQDTDVYKWLEGVSYILAQRCDSFLEQQADKVVELIAQAQCDDGYLDTYVILHPEYERWSNLMEGHELYCAGHLIEAAVAYYCATGKHMILTVATRFADLICQTFGDGDGQIHGYPGHPEIELALVKLADVTGNGAYLRQAKYFLDRRGSGKNWFLAEEERPGFHHQFPEFADYDPRYSQSHLPVREQKTAEGHAVRAVYLYCGMVDVAERTQDETLLRAAGTIWDNIVGRRMYLTGSIGSSGVLERFTCDYDLPNERNYSESCASIGLLQLGIRLARLYKDASYIDVAELALYNTVLAGVALDGKSFFYVNPLEVVPETCMSHTSMAHVKPVRQKWFGVACCPPNIARTIASLGLFVYSLEDATVFLNFFVSNTADLPDGTHIEVKTDYPRENTIEVMMSEIKEIRTLAIRVPHFARNYRVILGSQEIPYAKTLHRGYCHIALDGVQTVSIRITFEAPPVFVRANSRVAADAGKVAIKRGPQVYCAEETDNGKPLSAVYVDTSHRPEDQRVENGVVTVHFSGYRRTGNSTALYSTDDSFIMEKTEFVAVPYYCWGNRTPGEMAVWLKELIRLPDEGKK
jgi:hypothetical protein